MVAVLPSDKRAAAEFLATKGEEFDRKLCALIQSRRELAADAPEFVVCIVEALRWAMFANEEAPFAIHATAFLQDGEPAVADTASQSHLQYGRERLHEALWALRMLYQGLQDAFDSISADAGRLKDLQLDAIEFASRLAHVGELRGVGPWLFCAPFKIFAVSHPAIWGDKRLDDVLMPIGGQVKRSLSELFRLGMIRQTKMPEDDWSFMDRIATAWTLQKEYGQLADLASSRVMHVNTGLYRLGQKSDR